MHICFVNAPYDGPVTGIWTDVFPPLTVLSLCAYLRQERPHHRISVVDGLRVGFKKALRQAVEHGARVYAVSFVTFNASTAYRFVNALKQLHPQAVLVAGGTHVTSLEKDAFEKSRIDYAAHGEGERTLVELIDRIEGGGDVSQIKGILYREGSDVLRTEERPLIEDVSALPFPARDMVKMSDYSGLYIAKQLPNTNLLSGRGCVNHCLFCARRVWKRQSPKLRLRSAESIVGEIRELKQRYGMREVFDMGDEFNSSEEWATRTAASLAEARLGIPWQAFSRATPVTADMARVMREAGCWLVHLGIESGNQRTLNGIRKNITLEQARDAAATYQRHGIKVVGLFMLFHVWEEDGHLVYEGARESEQTLAFARRMHKDKLINSFTCSPAMPYPGSILYDVAVRHGIIPEDRFQDWGIWDHSWGSVMKLQGISDRDLQRVKLSGTWSQSWALLRSGHLNFSRAVWSRGLGAMKLFLASPLKRVPFLTGAGRKGIVP